MQEKKKFSYAKKSNKEISKENQKHSSLVTNPA